VFFKSLYLIRVGVCGGGWMGAGENMWLIRVEYCSLISIGLHEWKATFNNRRVGIILLLDIPYLFIL
jgi:hypothetical protein